MAYGDRELGRDDKGGDVVELQMRLAGFRGTLPDGDFGPGTELQVIAFQRDWMGQGAPHGRVDRDTFDAIEAFGADHPVDFDRLRCPCGVCPGFGRGGFEGQYRADRPQIEAFHLYEYPGIHRMLLWAFRATAFYAARRGKELIITSGYRCAERNRQKNRTSTNHHGKAIDFDVLGAADKREDMRNCEELCGLLVETASAQVGWGALNRKALEPKEIAPTWVHYDVRSYERRYLDDAYFVQDPAQLGRPPAGTA